MKQTNNDVILDALLIITTKGLELSWLTIDKWIQTLPLVYLQPPCLRVALKIINVFEFFVYHQ